MSRIFSFRDLRRIPTLSNYNEIQLLHPAMDAVINNCLEQLGFSLNHAIQYIPANHRDLSGKVEVGFRAVGEISQNREFINSHLCTMTERLVAAAQVDPSLTRELCTLMGNSLNISGEDAGEESSDFPDELVEPDYKNVVDQIAALERIRDEIRGTAYAEDGSLKLPGNYA